MTTADVFLAVYGDRLKYICIRRLLEEHLFPVFAPQRKPLQLIYVILYQVILLFCLQRKRKADAKDPRKTRSKTVKESKVSFFCE